MSFPSEMAFTAGNDGYFWDFLSLDAHTKQVSLGTALPPEQAKTLQVQLFNGWMDKFRTASPESTDCALRSFQKGDDLWAATFSRTGLQPSQNQVSFQTG